MTFVKGSFIAYASITCLIASLLMLTPTAIIANDNAEAWQALREGKAMAIMRHALAPGVGDPSNHADGVCSTQRNLSNAGRGQAQAIGDVFRANGIKQASVYSSSWCRCVDTATLLDLGKVAHLPAINSFFRQPSEIQATQTQALNDWVMQTSKNPQTGSLPIILVSHAVNIAAFTNAFPASGEIVIFSIENGDIKVLGQIETDPI